ncbi:MAG: HAMP domain-containing histidine kinase [Steroidobacteraceae bacterium]|jgi:signal transduction histidine kinase|nr:HAMP domain-containing histidine kinase [Steroidobacteraceae bacterium]
MKTLLFDRRALSAATLSAVAVVAAFIAAFAWLENRVASVLDAELAASLGRDLQLFQALERETGVDSVVVALQRRLAVPGGPRRYLLLDPAGRTVLGNGGAWPPDVATRADLSHVVLGDGPRLRVVSGPVGNGHRLFIGELDARQEQVGRSLVTAGVVAMLLVLFACLLVAWLANRYVGERLAGIAQAAREIMRGQMKARAPEGQRVDALGSLARVFNEMLDQNEALVTGMRTATESLAHDLRTPLMRLRRAIEAARDTSDPLQRDELLGSAESEAEHALRTFSALIDLARAEAGLSRDAMECTDLAELATDVADLFEPLAEERQQRLERDIRPATAVAHRQILFQALGNLLENAIKYSPAGVPLRLCLEPGSATQGPAFVVSDAGPGIPEHAREQVLRPFVRLETAGRKPGSGLGLAIAAAAARLHGGQLQLEDAEPGLRVRLQLGLDSRRGAASAGQSSSPSTSPSQPLRTSRGADSQGARPAARA